LKTPEYSLSERLKFLRESRKLTQGAMAKLAGLSQATIAHIEKGTKDPSVETLNKISRALDIHIATLFTTDDVFVFDMKRLRRKYDNVDRLTPHLYMALGKVVQYARDIEMIK
jgi:transcriptional regulator with XRE-family HTH domain